MVPLHNGLGNGEPQSRIACFAGAIAVHPIGAFKNTALFFRRNPKAYNFDSDGGGAIMGG
ncbi:hypothetical protein IQ273_01995 [Nodosilinea sp. LEGE 07298]|uniref:hypothetical protein n=1 Tax=Nodosilinea sp. LEGE 07298 TaxID=2777970 RepID=UPI001882D803|nr:hypothetical protein [Nodosilinea sp. LEGE 07298]MBE9108192.1 hypothetical protein [Nodosilinea sp. LEGE 07298]